MDYEFRFEDSGTFTAVWDIVAKRFLNGQKFHSQDSTAPPGTVANGWGSDLRDVMTIYRTDASTLWHIMTDSDGNLLIGDNAPGDAVNHFATGVVPWEFAFEQNGQFTSTGDMYCNGVVYSTGGFSDISDIRMKKDVKEIPQGILEKLATLHPIRFRLRSQDDNHPKQIGFSAQEVRKVFPEVVSARDSGDPNLGEMLSVSYGNLAVAAIGGINELNEKSDREDKFLKKDYLALKEENAALKQRLDDVISRLSALESRLP